MLHKVESYDTRFSSGENMQLEITAVQQIWYEVKLKTILFKKNDIIKIICSHNIQINLQLHHYAM